MFHLKIPLRHKTNGWTDGYWVSYLTNRHWTLTLYLRAKTLFLSFYKMDQVVL